MKSFMRRTLSSQNLRGVMNVSHPICRLPSELVATIFIHCAVDYHNNPQPPVGNVPSWVNVSYVCRHWRGVALDCPILWSYHFVVSLRWTEELLARSKQTLLKISIIDRYLGHIILWSRLMEKFINHTDRIHELHLDFQANCSIGHALPNFLPRLPRPQNLKISKGSFVLFHKDTPALRTLELCYSPMPQDLLKLTALTTLGLHCVPAGFQPQPDEFLAMLNCMRDLQHLYLDRALGDADRFLSTPAFKTFQKVNLPHLSRLLIIAPLPAVIVMLSCVDFPLRTELRLECDSNYDPHFDDYTWLCSTLAQRFGTSKDQTSSAMTVRSLTIGFNGDVGEVELTFNALERGHADPSIPTSDQDWDRNIPLRIVARMGLLLIGIDEDRVASNICCSIPLTNVQSVHVVDPPFSPIFWRKILGHLHELRYIKLSQGRMPDLASPLSLTDFDIHEDGVEDNRHIDHMLAPALEELELDRIVFLPEGNLVLLQRAITQQRLFDALSTRGVPQGRLLMTKCQGSVHDTSTFDVVRSWNGVIGVSEVSGGDSDSKFLLIKRTTSPVIGLLCARLYS